MKKLLFALYFTTLKVFAVSELYAGNEDLKLASNNIFAPSYYKMLLGLALVIGLIYITGIIYQKLIKVRVSNAEGDEYKPEIISTTPLGQNKNLHVVKIMDEYLLISSTQTNISYLKSLNNHDNRGQ